MTRLPEMMTRVLTDIFILLACISSVSCIPLVKESSAPPIDYDLLSSFFKNANERIMVLPVWEKYPVIITTKSIEESSTISVGTPLFLKVKDIRGIHKLIPSKTIAGLLVGPLVGVGRGVFFSGYYIISESGRVIWLETEHHTAKSVFLSREGKKELLEAFREFEQVYLLPASDVWLSMGKRKLFSKRKLFINYNSSNRNDIIKFISSVDAGIIGPSTTVWQNGDRYEGEWVDDKKYGRGTMVWANGNRYEGEWVGDKKYRRGTLVWANGNRYVMQNGRGKMTKASGDWYEGEWHNGYTDGEGKAQINDKMYEGVWARGCLRRREQQAAWDVPLQSAASSASTVAATTTRNDGDTTAISARVAGWDFTVDSALTINALGIYDSGGYGNLPSRHGLALSHTIKIYDAIRGLLISSASIDAGTDDPLIERTRWVQIPEVVLRPIVTYTIIANNMCVDDAKGGDSCGIYNITYASGINHMQGFMYSKGAALDLSARSSGDIHTTQIGFLGPNFAYLDEFTAVPIPAAALLYGIRTDGTDGNGKTQEVISTSYSVNSGSFGSRFHLR